MTPTLKKILEEHGKRLCDILYITIYKHGSIANINKRYYKDKINENKKKK